MSDLLVSIYVKAVADGVGGVKLSAKSVDPRVTILVLGSSVKMSVLPGEYVDSLTLYPELGEVGCLAVTVICDGRRGTSNHTALLYVENGKNGPAIGLSKEFVSDRAFQVYERRLEVQCGDRRYSTEPRTHAVIAANGNRLCEYIAHHIDEDAIQFTPAEGYNPKQRLEEELEKSRKQLEDSTRTNKRLMEDVRKLQDCWPKENEALRTKVQEVAATIMVRLSKNRWGLRNWLSSYVKKLEASIWEK